MELVRELGKRRELIESTAKGLWDNTCQYRFTRVMQVGLVAVESDQFFNPEFGQQKIPLSSCFGSIYGLVYALLLKEHIRLYIMIGQCY